jgi:hypothetical protein
MRKWLFFLILLAMIADVQSLLAEPAEAEVNTIQELMARLRSCWRPPPATDANAIIITVLVSFTRSGNILGHPKVTYESAEATDRDRLAYRIAAMESLQRCTPIPFTDAMGGAIAGHPVRLMMGKKPAAAPSQKQAELFRKLASNRMNQS